MNNVSEIAKIIEAGLQRDSTKVLNYTKLLISNLEESGDTKRANSISRILKKNKTLALTPQSNTLHLNRIPTDSESQLPLAQTETFLEGEIFLTLEDDIFADIEESIDLINRGDQLFSEDISAYRNLLLYGAPGTGKTQAAKYIAHKTNLPLVIVRMDGLISSYLGNTSKNIRTLFDFIDRNKCILFLDEFDAIAKMRDDNNELGELKRVVNALLQNIDSLKGKIPIIAATNHQHLLDPAIWRRFDYKINVPLPEKKERILLLFKELGNKIKDKKILELLSFLTKGMSGADIVILSEMVKTKIFLANSKLNINQVFELFLKCKRRIVSSNEEYNFLEKEYKINLLKKLREESKDFFSISLIAELLDVSTGTASSLMREEKDGE